MSKKRNKKQHTEYWHDYSNDDFATIKKKK